MHTMINGSDLLPQANHLPAANQREIFKLQFSRKEAARLLSISLRTVDRLIAAKKMPVCRIGSRVLIAHDVLKQFIKRDHQTQIQ